MRAARGFAACQSKKAQQPHSPGQRRGYWVYILISAPCKGKSVNNQCFCPCWASCFYQSVHPGRVPWAMCFCPFGASYSWVLAHSPLSKCSNVLVCKAIKKVSYLQSLFVMILQLFSPFASAARSDSVRRPPHNDGYISPESLPYSPMKTAATE